MTFPASLFGAPDWAGRPILAAIVVVAAGVTLVVLTRLAPWVTERATRKADPLRLRQRRTALALLFASLRYLVAVAAAAAATFAVAGGGSVAAVGGGALVVVMVGFASQRLLTDVIAGFFILFESQYAVGDFVRLEPSGIAGVVDELGVRTTVVRDMNGDICHVPNGQIAAVRRVPSGRRAFEIKLVTRDPEALATAVAEVAAIAPTGTARFLRGPRVVERRDTGGGFTALRVHAEVAPSLEWLVDRFLVDALRARAGDLLATEPVVFTLDPAVMERYRTELLPR